MPGVVKTIIKELEIKLAPEICLHFIITIILAYYRKKREDTHLKTAQSKPPEENQNQGKEIKSILLKDAKMSDANLLSQAVRSGIILVNILRTT